MKLSCQSFRQTDSIGLAKIDLKLKRTRAVEASITRESLIVTSYPRESRGAEGGS